MSLELLEPRELCLIYRYLSNAEIANASLVCRKWNWMLWRETEQSVLWLPRIVQTLNNNPKQRSQRLSLLLGDMLMKKELLGDTLDDVRHTLKVIKTKFAALIERVAHGLWISGEYKYLMRAPSDWRLDRVNGWQFFVRNDEPNSERNAIKSAYRVWWTDHNPIIGLPFKYGLVAFYGVVNSVDGSTTGQLVNEHGTMVYDGSWSSASGFPQGHGTSYYEETGTVQLRGEFQQSAPHGHSVFYRPDGTKAYDGEWVNGFQQGHGKLYYEDGLTISFEGTIANKVPLEGSWFNNEGVLIHRGTAAEFQLKLQEYQSRHQCTFELTGKLYANQQWWSCNTCFPGENEANKGVCMSCARRCHKNHELVPRGESGFFCDCGDSDNRCQATVACNSDCDCDKAEREAQAPPLIDGNLRFIHDPARAPLTRDEQQAYLIALMLELQGDGAGVPFNGIDQLDPDQRAVLLNQIEQALADF